MLENRASRATSKVNIYLYKQINHYCIMNVSKRNNNGIHTLPESVEIKKSKSINRSQQQCDK